MFNKVVFLANSNNSVLYFFPSTGSNKYSGSNLNLSCQLQKRGGRGEREFIPQITPCQLLDSFLMAWYSPTNINSLLISKGYELEDFNNKFSNINEGLLYIVKARAKAKRVAFIFTEEDKKQLINKIDELKANFTTKKAEFNKAEGKLGAILVDIKELEKANDELLNAENLDTKTFQQNSLKIAKLKHNNKALIDNRNALFNECETLKSELESLETELKELESV